MECVGRDESQQGPAATGRRDLLLVALVGVLADRPRGRASRASGASRNSRALLVEAGRRLLRERLGEIRGRTRASALPRRCEN
jgi:hypothetical protein